MIGTPATKVVLTPGTLVRFNKDVYLRESATPKHTWGIVIWCVGGLFVKVFTARAETIFVGRAALECLDLPIGDDTTQNSLPL